MSPRFQAESKRCPAHGCATDSGNVAELARVRAGGVAKLPEVLRLRLRPLPETIGASPVISEVRFDCGVLQNLANGSGVDAVKAILAADASLGYDGIAKLHSNPRLDSRKIQREFVGVSITMSRGPLDGDRT